jgi:hypothetical protein
MVGVEIVFMETNHRWSFYYSANCHRLQMSRVVNTSGILKQQLLQVDTASILLLTVLFKASDLLALSSSSWTRGSKEN